MSSIQAVTELPIPADRVEKALLTGAFPGFHGNVEVFVSIQPKAVEGVIIAAIRNNSLRMTTTKPGPELVPATQQTTEREGKVAEWMKVIRPNLMLRARIVKVIGHYKDGVLSTCEISEQ